MTGKNIISVDSIDSLRNISGTTNIVVSVISNNKLVYYTWDDANTTDDDTTIIKPNYFTTQAGRWIQIESPGGSNIELGTGLTTDTDGKATLDLSSTTLVQPQIRAGFSVKKNDGSLNFTYNYPYTTGGSYQIDKGSQVDITLYYKYPGATTGQALPTSVTGDFSVLAGADTESVVANLSSIVASRTLQVILAKAKSGLIVVNNQVQFASGQDTTSAAISLNFKDRVYFTMTTLSDLGSGNFDMSTLPQGSVTNAQLVDGISFLFSGITTGSDQYAYVIYPAAFGDLNSVIQNDSLPILGAFTKMSNINVANNSGLLVPCIVYRSNAVNPFSSAKLQFS
ncbi:hypothetical protein [Rhizosphaericola mali]|uniref:Uncharacterized protein n=1 Tax=Rhizosphaericola mali TaxID=2545455 RepID=A0A5P2G061_9BACT|nr:hypothetical protein [Rhizosphaericola mali]QES88875.1 hypothetical protein E0W69_009475 [Rhizosphaericola mali]